jgi:hypothetical protein
VDREGWGFMLELLPIRSLRRLWIGLPAVTMDLGRDSLLE